MPQLRLMKSIIERMKNLANMATLHVTSEGLLTLTVETEAVSVLHTLIIYMWKNKVTLML